MKRIKNAQVFVVIFFIFLTLFTFRSYVWKHQVPLPFNLLAVLYSPWKYQTWPGYPLGVQNKPLGFDNLKLFYPYRTFTTAEFKQGRIPLWNPYVFSGNVHAATYQSAVWYPLNILYFVLPQADAWSVFILLQPILVGWFTYLFLRSLGQSKAAGFLGAVGFAYSGWMIALWEEALVLVHSILWLPLALFASNLIWEGKHQKQGFLLLVIALSFSILAGFLQMSIYVFATVILWNIYRYRAANTQNRTRGSGVVVMGVIAGILVSAIQWVGAFEAYLLSSRGVVNAKFLFDQFLSPVTHLITFIVPDFWGNPGSYNYFSSLVYIQERVVYIGIFVFIFAIFMYCIRTSRDINFWKIFTAATLSLGFALPTSWIWYVFHVPILSVAQPARIFVLSTFGLCILAGYGIDAMNREGSRRIFSRIILSIGVVVGFLWTYVMCVWFIVHIKSFLFDWCLGQSTRLCSDIGNFYDQKWPYLTATVSLRNLLLPTVFLIIAWGSFHFMKKNRTVFFVTALIATIMGSLYFANKMLYFSDRLFEYPQTMPISTLGSLAGINRVWSYGDGYIMRNVLSYYNIFSPEGYDALYPQRYGELLYTIGTKGVVTDQINRTDVSLGETGQNELMTNNPRRLRLMSLLGVKYIMEHKEDNGKDAILPEKRFPPNLFDLVWQNDAWRIWQYKDALPRTFIAHDILIENDPQKIVDQLYNSNVNLHSTVILEKPFSLLTEDLGAQGEESASISAYEANRVTITVYAKSPGVLFLSDTYYPGWEAYVDGKKTPIYRANYAFRAVPVRQGQHTVTFLYRPASFILGVVLSNIGIIFIIFVSVYLFLRQKSVVARRGTMQKLVKGV